MAAMGAGTACLGTAHFRLLRKHAYSRVDWVLEDRAGQRAHGESLRLAGTVAMIGQAGDEQFRE